MVTKWLKEETTQSSTWRELKTVWAYFATNWKNHKVRWFTDNQNVARIVLYRSRKSVLPEEALAIFATYVKYHIGLELSGSTKRKMNLQITLVR